MDLANKENVDEFSKNDLEKINLELGCQLKVLKLEKENLHSKLEITRKGFLSILKRNIENAQKKRWKKILKNNIKIGHVMSLRQGVQFVDCWEKGLKYKKLEKSINMNHKSREEIEKKKKTLLKQIKQFHSQIQADQNQCDESTRNKKEYLIELFLNEIELLKLQLLSLKKEENDLNVKMEQLNRAKNSHIRDLNHHSVESGSRFNLGEPIKGGNYILIQAIGKGGFSEVFKAYDINNMREVACKIHQVSNEWKEEMINNYVKHAMREFEIHKSLDHPNIASLYDVFVVDNNTFSSVLEFCETDLDFILKQFRVLPEREAKLIILQVVSALKYLNMIKPPVIHYDLKPANILFKDTNNWHIKLTDFGLSKIMPMNMGEGDITSMELTSQGAGTYWYLPPECFVIGKIPPKISSKVDVWSIGVILYQIIYGKKPFGHNMTQPDVVKNETILNARKVEFKPRPALSNHGKEFIRRCLTYDKDKRPDVLQLSEDIYLVGRKNSSSVIDRQQNSSTITTISPTVINNNSSKSTKQNFSYISDTNSNQSNP